MRRLRVRRVADQCKGLYLIIAWNNSRNYTSAHSAVDSDSRLDTRCLKQKMAFRMYMFDTSASDYESPSKFTAIVFCWMGHQLHFANADHGD